MRCAKCGYFSFDYLSECKKCRTSLADVRRGFGFSGAAPAIPSLLAALFRDYEPVVNMEDGTAAIAMSDPLDFEERPAVALEPAEQESRRAAPPPVIAGNVEAEEDFSLLDLTDEELDLLMDKSAFAADDEESPIQMRADTDDADFTLPEPPEIEMPPEQASDKLELVFDPNDYLPEPRDESPAAAATTVPEQGLPPDLPDLAEMPPEQASDKLELVFDPDDYLPEPRDESPAAAATAVPEQELPLDLPDLAEAAAISAADFKASTGPDGPESDKPDDDFVIELSDDDLDELLIKLSHPPKDEAGAEGER